MHVNLVSPWSAPWFNASERKGTKTHLPPSEVRPVHLLLRHGRRSQIKLRAPHQLPSTPPDDLRSKKMGSHK